MKSYLVPRFIVVEQQVRSKPKLKARTKEKVETPLVIAEAFHVADAKDNDFDLDLDAALFSGKKGEAGTRSKAKA